MHKDDCNRIKNLDAKNKKLEQTLGNFEITSLLTVLEEVLERYEKEFYRRNAAEFDPFFDKVNTEKSTNFSPYEHSCRNKSPSANFRSLGTRNILVNEVSEASSFISANR